MNTLTHTRRALGAWLDEHAYAVALSAVALVGVALSALVAVASYLDGIVSGSDTFVLATLVLVACGVVGITVGLIASVQASDTATANVSHAYADEVVSLSLAYEHTRATLNEVVAQRDALASRCDTLQAQVNAHANTIDGHFDAMMRYAREAKNYEERANNASDDDDVDALRDEASTNRRASAWHKWQMNLLIDEHDAMTSRVDMSDTYTREDR